MRPRRQTSTKSIVKTVDKALMVLETLADAEETGLTLEAISLRTGVNRVTAWRLLATLKRRGFVKYDPLTHEYRLGPVLLQIGGAAYARFDLRGQVRPVLEQLVEATGETANFGILLGGGEMMFTEQIRSPLMVHATPQLGMHLPLHCTAAGKAMLAFLPEEEVERIVREKGLKALTDKSITDLAWLKKELAEIRARGYATDDEETEVGGRCVGAPILGSEGQPIGSISVTVPSNRILEARFDELGLLVMNAARKLSLMDRR